MECAVKTNVDRKYNHVCTIITMESVVETKYYILTDNDFLPCANQGDHNICIFFYLGTKILHYAHAHPFYRMKFVGIC